MYVSVADSYRYLWLTIANIYFRISACKNRNVRVVATSLPSAGFSIKYILNRFRFFNCKNGNAGTAAGQAGCAYLFWFFYL